jgi:hypothetical protein
VSNATDPAFPLPSEVTSSSWASGLSKRELLAAMAMQGIIAQMPKAERAQEVARQAVVCADALLLELSKVQS